MAAQAMAVALLACSAAALQPSLFMGHRRICHQCVPTTPRSVRPMAVQAEIDAAPSASTAFEEWAEQSGIQAGKLRIVGGDEAKKSRRSAGKGGSRKGTSRKASAAAAEPLREYLLPETLRGVVAIEAIAEGEEMLRVPRGRCLDLAIAPTTPCPQLVPNGLWETLAWYERLALWLLAEKARGADSAIVGYVSYLPPPHAFDDAPLSWTEEELSELRYPPFAAAVREQAASL
eukprot:2975404-Pleurochrysis_carterae.AAC.1